MPALIGVLLYLGLMVTVVYGYVHNIVEIVVQHQIVDFMLILRVVGIFVAPLGVILGFM